MMMQKQLDDRRHSAQYIENYSQRMAEIAEIERLQKQLTPLSSNEHIEPKRQSASRLKPANQTTKQHLKEQCLAKLAKGVPNDNVAKFLTAMAR